MKARKQIMLDEKLIKELHTVGNSSALINELLTEYFNNTSIMTLEKLKNELFNKQNNLNKLNTEITNIKDRIDEIETRNKRIKEIFKNIPVEILNDFKTFPMMTEEILSKRYKEIYSIIYKIEWAEVLSAFRKYHKPF